MRRVSREFAAPPRQISILWLAGNDERGKERRFFWTVLGVAAGVSIAGNALHAWVSHAPDFDPLLAATISTIPPISLLAASHWLTILARTPKRAPVGEGSGGTSSSPRTISDEPVRDAPNQAEIAVTDTDSQPERLATPAVMAEAQDQPAAPSIERMSASEGHDVETAGMADESVPFASYPTVTSSTPPRDPIAVDLSTATTDQLCDYALRRKALGVKPKEIAVKVNRNISTVHRWIDDAAKSAGRPATRPVENSSTRATRPAASECQTLSSAGRKVVPEQGLNLVGREWNDLGNARRATVPST